MKIEQIYSEFELGLEKEYYAHLAEKEIMTVPALVEVFLDDDYANALWAEETLEYISTNNPKLVYPFFEFVSKGLENNNSFLGWSTWKILARLLQVDSDNKFESIKDKFYSALCSKNLPEFSIACDCAEFVFSFKPDERERLLDIMKNSSKRRFFVGDTELENSGKIAEEKAQLFLERIIDDKKKD